MKKNEFISYIDNCNNSLEGFVLSPLKKLDECLIYLDSFQNYLSKIEFPYLLEKVKNISNILFTTKHYLEYTKYLDPDLMEELLFFLKGAFLDLSDHIDEIVDKDLETLKNKHWQKILFLNDWVKDFLKLPDAIIPVVAEKLEKYLIFNLGKDQFTIPLESFVEIFLLKTKKTLTKK